MPTLPTSIVVGHDRIEIIFKRLKGDYGRYVKNKIYIDNRQLPIKQLSTIFHELAHKFDEYFSLAEGFNLTEQQKEVLANSIENGFMSVLTQSPEFVEWMVVTVRGDKQ